MNYDCGNPACAPEAQPHMQTHSGFSKDGTRIFSVKLATGESVAALDLDLCGDKMLRACEESHDVPLLSDEVFAGDTAQIPKEWAERAPDRVFTWHRVMAFAHTDDKAVASMLNEMMVILAGHYQARLEHRD